MVWVKLGTFPDMTIEQARNEATKKLGDFAVGKNPAKVKREEKQKLTLGQAFDQYMKMYWKTSPSTICGVASAVGRPSVAHRWP